MVASKSFILSVLLSASVVFATPMAGSRKDLLTREYNAQLLTRGAGTNTGPCSFADGSPTIAFGQTGCCPPDSESGQTITQCTCGGDGAVPVSQCDSGLFGKTNTCVVNGGSAGCSNGKSPDKGGF